MIAKPDFLPVDLPIPWQNYRSAIRLLLRLGRLLIERFERERPDLTTALTTGGGPTGAPYRTEASADFGVRCHEWDDLVTCLRATDAWLLTASEIDPIGVTDKRTIAATYDLAKEITKPFGDQVERLARDAHVGIAPLTHANYAQYRAAEMICHLTSNSGCTAENANHKLAEVLRRLHQAQLYDKPLRQDLMDALYTELAAGLPLHDDVKPAYEAAWLGGMIPTACQLVLDAVANRYLREAL